MTATLVLPAPPASMPTVTVDTGSIERCGAQLLAASARVDDLGTFVAGSAKVPSWTGDGADAYHRTIAPMGRDADAMSLALRSVARRVDAHAERMADLERRHGDLVSHRATLAGGIVTLREDFDRVGGDPEMIPVLQGRSDNLAQSIGDYHRDRSAWITEVAEEERAMVASFQRVMTLDQVAALWGGVEDPADDALASKPPAGSSPQVVNAWWRGLTQAQRDAVVAASPGSIGNLDGIPAGARSDANTVRLDRDLADLRSLDPDLMTDAEEQRLENAEAADDARRRIGEDLDPVTGEPVEAQVYIYDPDAFGGDGRIAVSAGDLDTADNVSVVVPGLGTDATSAGAQADRASNVYEAARTLDGTQTNATLFWIGYDAPDNVPFVNGPGADAAGVVKEDMAEAGGRRLSDTVDGLRASRSDDPAHLTVIGHSYGSTTVAHGATDDGLDADDIILTGSPGAGGGTDHASDLGVGADHVFVGANTRDPVAALADNGWIGGGTLFGAGLGNDPAEDDFGAVRFQAESTTRGEGGFFDDHSKYFDHDTESLHNIAQVVNGNYDGVMEAGHIHDPWYAGPQDPEDDRDPTEQTTRR